MQASAKNPDGDHVDEVLADWSREWPELDTAPVGVVARVGRVASYLDRGLNQVFAEFGLDRAEFDVLATLRRAGRPYRRSPTELQRALMRTSGAITHIVDRLEQAGLVARSPDPDDRRGLLVALTPKGLRLFDKIVTMHLENERRLLHGLTQADQAALAALLRKLLLSFET
jgi:DNA-binding MarR family transcriptional regulator